MFWEQAEQVIEQAKVNGSLYPIATEAVAIEQNGITYLGHIVAKNSAQRKFTPKPTADFNPFLPYEQDMFVAEAGEEHVCLLNKFPVITPHLLICSKQFISQESPLELEDFAAWLRGFESDNVLGFYNGGPVAGASQAHRHMQLVQSEVPLEALILSERLPFEHRLYRYHRPSSEKLYISYLAAMREMKLFGSEENNNKCKPYNILLTRHWMLVIPRSRNCIEDIFANGMNYSGRFLVKNAEQLEWLKTHGLLNLLQACAIAKDLEDEC
ncbi:phosphorylase [Photobacterium damselae]|nr:phosphorylase [Photobacterium damselae]